MRIIFLDIDGVLNSRQYDIERRVTDGNMDGSRLLLLKQLIECTGAEIVLTSSWRHHWDPGGEHTDEVGKEVEETFLQYGLFLYDKTPVIDNDREKEIEAWLEARPDIHRYVIIDDIKFGWNRLRGRVVQTDYGIGRGLEPKHIEKAIEILLKAEWHQE